MNSLSGQTVDLHSYQYLVIMMWGYNLKNKFDRMENIVSVSGKLLYFARHLATTKQINSSQLAALKDMIIAGNEDVMAAYNQYTSAGTELTLASSLIRLLRNERDSESEEAVSQSSRRVKRGTMSIVIPKRNIQRLPAGMERL